MAGRHAENAVFPITRDITCMHCGQRGLMDIRDENAEVDDDRLFLYMGHNPFSGDLHYQCPACGIILLVDPMLALGNTAIRGIPDLAARSGETGQTFLNGLFSSLFHGTDSGHRLS
jgi:hypothetical protein